MHENLSILSKYLHSHKLFKIVSKIKVMIEKYNNNDLNALIPKALGINILPPVFEENETSHFKNKNQ